MGFKTQADLAAAIGTDRTRVSRWESGEDQPGAYKEKLLEVLESDESLFDGEPESPKLLLIAEIMRMSDAEAINLLRTLQSSGDFSDFDEPEMTSSSRRR